MKRNRWPRNCYAFTRDVAEVRKRFGDILPLVLARLGVGALQSTESGERDST